jgi:glycerate dehydrogenase
MMKIAFLDGYTIDLHDMDWASFYDLGDLHFYEHTSDSEFASRVKDVDILIVNKFKVTSQVLECAPNLKLIVVAATGYNNLDLPAISQRGIVACNVRGYSSSGVAQHVWSLLLNHYSKIQHYINEVKHGRWNTTRDFCFYDHSIEEVAGKVLGIIGFGNIGKSVAKIANGFDMKVITHSAYDLPHEYSYVEKVSIDQLYEQSDIISLHCPLSDKTKGLINKQSLAKMKPDTILINTSRGPLINEEDLRQHLIDTPSFTALIDVLSVEPPQNGNALLGLDNCNITPHIAWAYKQSRQRLIDGLAQNIKAYQEGSPINLVV